jgi:hypothetical protein
MPNIRIRDKWEPMVKQIIADLGPRAGPTPILRELKERVERLRRSGAQVSTDYPSPRTIQRIKDDLPREELREYERFHWPQSMESGALPWAAGRAALELLGFQRAMNLLLRTYQEKGDARTTGFDLRTENPNVRVVRWYWRLSQVAPDLPLVCTEDSVMVRYQFPSRYHLAYALAAHEAAGTTSKKFLSRVEAYLAFTPWQNERAADVYRHAVDRGVALGLMGDDLNADLPLTPYLTEAMAGVFGTELTKHWEQEGVPWVSLQQEEEIDG